MRVVTAVAIIASTFFGANLAINWAERSRERILGFAPECSAEQAEVLGPGTYKCLTLENGKRVWWKVENE